MASFAARNICSKHLKRKKKYIKSSIVCNLRKIDQIRVINYLNGINIESVPVITVLYSNFMRFYCPV